MYKNVNDVSKIYYTQNKRRVVIALVSPISAFDSP